MSETPADVEEAKAKGRRIAALTRDHLEALQAAGFDESDAFELATNYHWALATEDDDE